MSQITRAALVLVLVLGGLTTLYGYRKLGWFSGENRAELVVGHLPVT